MGGFVGALIGRHLKHTEEQHQDMRAMVMKPVASYMQDPANSTYTPEQVDQALETGFKMNLFPKEYKAAIMPVIEAGKAKWTAKQNLDEMNRQSAASKEGAGSQGQGMGIPNMQPNATPPAALPKPPEPAPPPAGPLSMMGMGASAPPSLPAPPAAPPPSPFVNGAGAGPAPLQGENPAMKIASDAGTAGFGAPPPVAAPAPAPASMLPKPPALTAQAGPGPVPFWHGRTAVDMAEQKANAEVAGMRVLAQYGKERVDNALAMLDRMGVNRNSLSSTQLAAFISTGAVPEPGFHDIPKGGVAVMNTGETPKVIFGQHEPVSTAPGAKTTFLDNPAIQPGVIYDQNNAMLNPPAGTPGAPGGAGGAGGGPGFTTVEAPPLLQPKQRAANAMWEKKNGQPITPDKYGEAMSQYNEASISPSAREMQRQRILNYADLRAVRALDQAKLNQTIREFNTTRGPEAIESLADQVHQNPDLFTKLTGDVANQVAQRFSAKYGLPAPRPLPADMRNKEDGSIISLNHVDAIQKLLAENPVIQKRMGKWDGRVGNIEQAIGDTTGLKPEEAKVIQEFRTRLTYLFAQEGKAVFGGRPPQKLMDDLKASSPNMKQGLPLFEGALNAVKGMGDLNIQSANDYRYNKRALPAPPPGTPTHAIPDLGSTFNGGRVLRVTPVK